MMSKVDNDEIRDYELAIKDMQLSVSSDKMLQKTYADVKLGYSSIKFKGTEADCDKIYKEIVKRGGKVIGIYY